MGKIVHYEDISKETIINAITFALSEEAQENARKVSYSYRNRIQTPQQTAVWWAEHVIATGGVPLTKSQSTFMPAYAYHLLDVYAFVAAVLFIFIASWIWFVKLLCCGQKSNSSSSSKIKSN